MKLIMDIQSEICYFEMDPGLLYGQVSDDRPLPRPTGPEVGRINIRSLPKVDYL